MLDRGLTTIGDEMEDLGTACTIFFFTGCFAAGGIVAFVFTGQYGALGLSAVAGIGGLAYGLGALGLTRDEVNKIRSELSNYRSAFNAVKKLEQVQGNKDLMKSVEDIQSKVHTVEPKWD